jgi:hypothetical protein
MLLFPKDHTAINGPPSNCPLVRLHVLCSKLSTELILRDYPSSRVANSSLPNLCFVGEEAVDGEGELVDEDDEDEDEDDEVDENKDASDENVQSRSLSDA